MYIVKGRSQEAGKKEKKKMAAKRRKRTQKNSYGWIYFFGQDGQGCPNAAAYMDVH